MAQENKVQAVAGQVLEKIGQKFENYSLYNPLEEVYVSLDRHGYFAGDTGWFKANVLTNGFPLPLSRVLYADIADSSGNVIIKRKFFIDSSGVVAGAIPLSKKGGWYSLRVYTLWMLNNEKEIEEKIIYITDSIQPGRKLANKLSKNQIHEIEFYPQGGKLVAGLNNSLIFYTENNELSFSGYIMNKWGDTLACFHSNQTNTGEISLEPDKADSLYAVVIWSDGNKKIFYLPEIHPEGATVQTTWSGEKLYFRIEASQKIINNNDYILLGAEMNNTIIWSKELITGHVTGGYSGFIPCDKLPEGIIRFFILDQKGEKLAERFSYHSSLADTGIFLTNRTISFDPKGFNHFTLNIPGEIAGNISVSVVDAGFDQLFNPLEKGLTQQETAIKKTDLITCIKSNKARWEKVMSDSLPAAKFPIEEGLVVAGQVFTGNKKKPVTNATITLLSAQKDSSFIFLSDSLTQEGGFYFGQLDFSDSALFYWSIREKKDRLSEEYHLTKGNHYFDTLEKRNVIVPFQWVNNIATNPNIDTYQQIYKRRKGDLEEVIVVAVKKTRIEELDEYYTQGGLFSGNLIFGEQFDMQSQKGAYMDIMAFLNGKIPGLVVRKMANSFDYRVTWRGDDVNFFLNEAPVETSYIQSINVSDIAYIKVIRPPFSHILQPNLTGLAIAVFTKKGDEEKKLSKVPVLQRFLLMGYSPSLSFTHVDYSNNENIEGKADNRVTLFWNPDVKFESGQAEIKFYNNDFSKSFKVRVQGITADGSKIFKEWLLN